MRPRRDSVRTFFLRAVLCAFVAHVAVATEFDPKCLARLFQKPVNFEEVEQLLEGVENPGARARLRELLGWDDSNIAYFSVLWRKRKATQASVPMRIIDPADAVKAEGVVEVFPAAIAPPDLLKELPHTHYEDILASRAEYEKKAKRALLWVKKMQAGTGSSVLRQSYLARMASLPEADVRIGAKGTDLYVEIPHPKRKGEKVSVSLAELQILRSLIDAKKGRYGGLAWQDIIGTETADSVRALWRKPSLLNPKKTYEQYLSSTPRLQRVPESFQAHMPTVDVSGHLTFARKAPAGHGLFGVDALLSAYKEGAVPRQVGKSTVAVIGNGEDLSSSPDPAMVGWMLKHRIPIVMVTTEKTAIDLKGGQIALLREPGGRVVAGIVEQAQAKEAGQLALFEKLGLEVKRDDQMAFFNTNMALFNYDELGPKIQKLVHEIGEKEFLRVISPDLIANTKEQKDAAGVLRKYVQLEGAMGSVVLNLDKYWRRRYGEPLVHVLNVGRENRTDFFSPIKTAFDYFVQFHSDRFRLDPKTLRLINERPGHLPSVTLNDAATKDKFYADVDNVLASFKGSSLKDLDSLQIDGQVAVAGLALKGRVAIRNASGKAVDLAKELPGVKTLENVSVMIDEAGRTTMQRFPNSIY